MEECYIVVLPHVELKTYVFPNDDHEKKEYTLENALELTGNGLYNILLVSNSALILMGIGMDIFGLSLVVQAGCDLETTVTQKGILTSLPFIGIFLVSYVWGYVADTKGRRITLVVPILISFLLSCIGSLSPNWIFLGVIKFLCVCFSCAANSVTYTLVGESCIQRVRSKYLVLITSLLLFSTAAGALVTYPILKLDFAVDIPWLGIIYRPWRLLVIALALPSGIGAIIMYFFCESPKFLYNSGRHDEALEVLKCMYAVNHRGSEKEYPVNALKVESQTKVKKMSIIRSLYEQSAPLFRAPYLWRSIQLFYIVAVVFITNNSFLIWLPHILNTVITLMTKQGSVTGNVCQLLSLESSLQTASNTTIVDPMHPTLCVSTVKENVIFTMLASQSIFAFINFLISYLPNRRRIVLICILCVSAVSGVCLNLVTDPLGSVFLFVTFTCTCLAMGIMASYFVDVYSTSYRGMASCLSIMVGRSATFVGINVAGSLIFTHCETTFYMWSLLVLSSAVAAWFLPPDKTLSS